MNTYTELELEKIKIREEIKKLQERLRAIEEEQNKIIAEKINKGGWLLGYNLTLLILLLTSLVIWFFTEKDYKANGDNSISLLFLLWIIRIGLTLSTTITIYFILKR